MEKYEMKKIIFYMVIISVFSIAFISGYATRSNDFLNCKGVIMECNKHTLKWAVKITSGKINEKKRKIVSSFSLFLCYMNAAPIAKTRIEKAPKRTMPTTAITSSFRNSTIALSTKSPIATINPITAIPASNIGSIPSNIWSYRLP